MKVVKPLPPTTITWNDGWDRSVCSAHRYPNFSGRQKTRLPDTEFVKQNPAFAGIIRYEKHFAERLDCLELSDAYEGVELFVNGESLGIQVAPPFRYDLRNISWKDDNVIAIEVATTLERQIASLKNLGNATKIPTPMGICGDIRVAAKMQDDSG